MPNQHAAQPLVPWDGSDARNVSADVLGLFSSISSPIPVVGTILSPILGSVKEIVVSVGEVEDNKEAAEGLAKQVLELVKRIVDHLNDANVPLQPDSSFAKIMKELEQDLKKVLDSILQCKRSGDKWYRAWPQRKKIKQVLDDAKEDFNRATNQAQFFMIMGLQNPVVTTSTGSAVTSPSNLPAPAQVPGTSASSAPQQIAPAAPAHPSSPAQTGTSQTRAAPEAAVQGPSLVAQTEVQAPPQPTAHNQASPPPPPYGLAPSSNSAAAAPAPAPAAAPHDPHYERMAATVEQARPHDLRTFQHVQEATQLVLEMDMEAEAAKQKRNKRRKELGLPLEP